VLNLLAEMLIVKGVKDPNCEGADPHAKSFNSSRKY